MATSGPKPVPKAVPKAVPRTGPQAVPSNTETEELPAVKKPKKKLLIIASLLMLLLGVGGAGAWYVLDQSKDTPAASAVAGEVKPEVIKPPVFVVLEPFTVNLQTDASEQFLQVSFTLQVADQSQVELIKLYMPQIRSRLLLLLSSKRAAEISTVEGKTKLSNEIIEQVKQPFSTGGAPQNVSNVFFTSFVIQ
jgi:flagellar FliL protein